MTALATWLSCLVNSATTWRYSSRASGGLNVREYVCRDKKQGPDNRHTTIIDTTQITFQRIKTDFASFGGILHHTEKT